MRMHPAVPRGTNVEMFHPLSIKEVPQFSTRARPVYVESIAKLRMMFCTIALAVLYALTK